MIPEKGETMKNKIMIFLIWFALGLLTLAFLISVINIIKKLDAEETKQRKEESQYICTEATAQARANYVAQCRGFVASFETCKREAILLLCNKPVK